MCLPVVAREAKGAMISLKAMCPLKIKAKEDREEGRENSYVRTLRNSLDIICTLTIGFC